MRTTTTMAVAVIGLLPTQASAQLVVDHSNVHIYTAQQIGMAIQPLDAPGGGFVSYSSIDKSMASWGTGNGNSLIDDYTSIADPGNNILGELRFFGGVDVQDGVLFFLFFDTEGVFVESFGLQFPVEGTFLWMLPFPIDVPAAGFLQVIEDDVGKIGPPTELTWLSTEIGATIGSNVFVPGGATGAQNDTAFAFELRLLLDCNGNGIPDSEDIFFGTSQDCNGNGVPDECDIASGTSQDVNNNDVPDACECLSDLDGDGTVGITDFLKLLADWGPCK
jgi:hypothetical protein